MEESQASVVVTTSDVPIIDEKLNQIIAAHKEVVECTWRLMETGNDFIAKAARVGHLLIAKKEEVGHGNWLPWLAEHVKDFGHDTARDYMKAARYYDQNRNLQNEGEPITMRYIKNLKQAAGILEDKPAGDPQEREKPPFLIRCVFNVEPQKLDELQRHTAFDQARPLLEAFQAFGFIEIKA